MTPILRGSAIAMLLAACALPEPERPTVRVEAAFWIHGDVSFRPEERQLAESAASRWRAFTRGGANISIAWDLDELTLLDLAEQPRMLRLDSLDARVQVIDAQHPGCRTRGFAKPADDRGPLIIGIVTDRAEDLFPIFLHELGHAAGLDELPEGARGVMSSTSPAREFTGADLEECRRVLVCERHHARR